MSYDFIGVGLGNPGARYAFTRHNIGFIALDLLAQEKGTKFSSQGVGKKIGAEWAEVELGSKKLFLLKPQTFMNLSGESLQKLYQHANHLRDIPGVCLHDEVDIALGKVRVKLGGSDAGHNGLKSLRQHLGHGDYFRIRIGIGRPPAGSPLGVADYVLQNFAKEEEEALMKELGKTTNVLEALVREGLPAALVIASREGK